MRFPLQGAVLLETSHISLDDSALACARLGSLDSRAPLARRVRFAAQIVYAADPSSVAPQGEGGCPPMYRLVTDCRSFHLQFNPSSRYPS